LKNSPLESSCVVVALKENYSTSKPLKTSPEQSQILSSDTLVAHERYVGSDGIEVGFIAMFYYILFIFLLFSIYNPVVIIIIIIIITINKEKRV
jgi:hypothetical protein